MMREVTRYEIGPPGEIPLTSPAFDINAFYEFENLGGGSTRVTESVEVLPKDIAKALFFLFGWLMKKSSCDALQSELNSLKENSNRVRVQIRSENRDWQRGTQPVWWE